MKTGQAAPLKLVFLGSPEFAVPSLETLHQDPRFSVSLVITQPDRRAGRGRALQAPAIKAAAEIHELRVIQPSSLGDSETLDVIRSTGADLFVVVAYGEKLSRQLLETPRYGCLNVHPSLLPHYRGSSPVPAAILNGDAATGVSIIRLTRRLDSGPIVSRTAVGLHGHETAGDLSRELSQLAASILPDVASGWCRGSIIPFRQDHAAATYTTELTKADGRIDWREPGGWIERKVRAMTPWPGCWTEIEGHRLGIAQVAVRPAAEAALGEHQQGRSPGLLLAPESQAATRADRHPGVVAKDGVVRLLRVTPPGKREMNGADWWRGSRFEAGVRAGLVDV